MEQEQHHRLNFPETWERSKILKQEWHLRVDLPHFYSQIM